MKKKKDKFYLYISITIGVILFGIIITQLIAQVKSKNSTDVRARASAAQSLKMTGVVSGSDPQTQTLTVDNMRFDGEVKMLPGIWTVSLPSQLQVDAFVPGTEIVVGVNSTSLKLASKTVSAVFVSKK